MMKTGLHTVARGVTRSLCPPKMRVAPQALTQHVASKVAWVLSSRLLLALLESNTEPAEQRLPAMYAVWHVGTTVTSALELSLLGSASGLVRVATTVRSPGWLALVGMMYSLHAKVNQ